MVAVIIEEYDPRWPDLYEQFRARAAEALGPVAAAIEHVGSTSVPGLAAKPVIDMDVMLNPAHGLSVAIASLGRLGYVHQGDLGIAGREAFQAPAGDFSHHLYVCLPGNREYGRHVTFRNWLRSHPEDADAYGRLKYELAARYRDDRNAYTIAKGNFVEEILGRSAGGYDA